MIRHALIPLAATALSVCACFSAACGGGRAWQPYERESIGGDAPSDQDAQPKHGALQPYYDWLQTRLGTTWASWDVRYHDPVSGRIDDDPITDASAPPQPSSATESEAQSESEATIRPFYPAASIRVRTLNARQADSLIRESAANFGLYLARINRSGRYTPASWDIELLVPGEANDGRRLREYDLAMRALAASAVRDKTWLDAMLLSDAENTLQVRLPRTSGERTELYDVYRKLNDHLTPAKLDYDVRKLGDEEDKAIGWTIQIQWTPAATIEEVKRAVIPPHPWSPAGSGGATPVRDSNDAMKNHPMEER